MGTNAREVGTFGLAIAAELRAAIARSGLSQRKFSEKSGIPIATLNKTLKGNRVADAEDMYAITEALDIDLAQLILDAQRHMQASAGFDRNNLALAADERTDESMRQQEIEQELP